MIRPADQEPSGPENVVAFPGEREPIKINGLHYPLWSKFVWGKEDFIGGILEELSPSPAVTLITDIRLTPNGADSAAFHVDGEDFGCGGDVKYTGITGGEEGWLTFSGYGGHRWRIKRRA
jgi:hypothetical protein